MNSEELKPFVGAGTKSKLILDTIAYDRIIKVDSNKPSDNITWEYVKSISKKKKAYQSLIDFLLMKGYNQDSNIDVIFEEWWDYEISKFKRQKSVKSKSTSLSNIQYEITQFTELNDFFKLHNKESEFKSFLGSIPTNSKIINPLNRFLKTLNNIVTDSFEIIEKEICGCKLNLNKVEQVEWKSDMVTYIHKFKGDISELNDVDIYKNNILKSNTFLNTLFNLEEKGVGKGELLLSYLFRHSKISGGNKPYDISLEQFDDTNVIIGDKKYEVKDYSNDRNAIRLGEGGKLTQFLFWNSIGETVTIASNFFSEHEELNIYLDKVFYKLWENLVNNEESEDGETNRSIALGVRKGEFNNSQLNCLKMWYFMMHELMCNLNEKSNRSSLENELLEFDKLEYVKEPIKLQKDLDKTSEIYFNRHKGLDAFVVFRNDKINVCHKEDLVYKTISQAGVKLIEREYLKDEDLGTKMMRAYEKWNENKKKSYYELYVEELDS